MSELRSLTSQAREQSEIPWVVCREEKVKDALKAEKRALLELSTLAKTEGALMFVKAHGTAVSSVRSTDLVSEGHLRFHGPSSASLARAL